MSPRIPSSRPSLKTVLAVCVGAVILGPMIVGGTGVRAQVDNPITKVLAALDSLAAAVAGVQQSVDALGAPDTSNVRVTPPLFASGGVEHVFVHCNVLNVASVPRTIRMQSVGTEPLINSTFMLGAGQTAVSTTHGRGSGAYCLFTVVDGVKADIRASMGLGPASSPSAALAAE
jgi:hypothetical protein